jgi:6-phosphogluconolactonase
MKGMLHIYPDTLKLTDALAENWARLAEAAIARQGAFYIALAGGSTPRQLYERLAREPYRNAVDWSRVHVFFGDERCVPRDHVESNYRMASEALLSKVSMPSAHIHPMYDPARSPAQNAEGYTAQLLATLPLDENGLPVFDLVLLGMGDDGHTASLFPDTSLLQEIERIVAAAYVEKLHAWRVSLTFPVINRARNVTVMVAGAGKAAMLESVFTDSAEHYPIQRVKPRGDLHWFLDEAAAQRLPENLRVC